MRGKTLGLSAAVVTAPLMLSVAALAAPVATIDISVSDGTNEQLVLMGDPTGPGSTHNFQGVFANANTVLTFDFNGNAVGSEGGFLGAGWTLENLSNAMLDYTISVTLDLDSGTGPITSYEGGGAFGLTGFGGLAGPTGMNPVFSVLMDGNLIDSGTIGSIAGGGNAFTGPLVGTTGPVSSSLTLVFQFSLESAPGQIFSSTGGIGIIPAPSVLALLGLAGLGGCRRRRA